MKKYKATLLDTSPNANGDVFTKECLEQLANQASVGGLIVHNGNEKPIGKVVSAVIENDQLIYTAMMHEHKPKTIE